MRLKIRFTTAKGSILTVTFSQNDITLERLAEICKREFPSAKPKDIHVVVEE